jgi:outer membrane receptor protein involved in Fe transport
LRRLIHDEWQTSLTATTAVKNWQIGLTGRWVGERDDLIFDPVTYVSERITLPSFTVFDLSLSRRTNLPVEPYFNIRNLFNHRYDEVAGYTAEGFSLESGIRLMW